MAEMASSVNEPESTATSFTSISFEGSYRNFVPGIALLLAGLMAPAMGLTDVYFAGAMAWVFVLWGLFFIYVALIDVYETWQLDQEALIIDDPLRFWERRREWPWADIYQVDVVVERPDARIEDAEMRVYYTAPGSGDIEREDRDYDPELTRLIIERAGLGPTDGAPADLAHLPQGAKATYVWK